METYGGVTEENAVEIDAEYKTILERCLHSEDSTWLTDYAEYGINTPIKYLVFTILYLKNYRLFSLSQLAIDHFFNHIFFLTSHSKHNDSERLYKWYHHEEKDIGNIIYSYRHKIVDGVIHTITDDTYYPIYDRESYLKLIAEEVDRICSNYTIDDDKNTEFKKSLLLLLGDKEHCYINYGCECYSELKNDTVRKLTSGTNLLPFDGAYEALGIKNDWEYICYQAQRGKIIGWDEILKTVNDAVLGSIKDQAVVYECSPHILLLMIYYGLNHLTDGEFSLREEKLLKDNTVDTIMIRKLVFDIVNDALKT